MNFQDEKQLAIQLADEFESSLKDSGLTIYDTAPKDREENLRFRELLEKVCEYTIAREFFRELCKRDVLFFLNVFCWVFEPRPDGEHGHGRLPFITWPAQDEAVAVTLECWGVSDMVVDKARGEGASWLFLMVILHAWLFADDMFTAGLASRNTDAVDNHRDPDSLMWKLDFQLKHLPEWMTGVRGRDWDRFVSDHSLVNHNLGHSIMGYSADDDLGTGGRKAQTLDSKILTPSGWTTMGQIRVGDEVIGGDGKPTRVIGVFPQGEKEIYEVQFKDGSKTKCCDEHVWAVSSASRRKHHKEPRFISQRLNEIWDDVVLEQPNGDRRFNYHTPVVGVVQFEEMTEPLPLEPYLLGCLLGDGCFTNAHKPVSLSTKDEEIRERCSQLLPVGVASKYSSGYDYNLVQEGCAGGLGVTNTLKDAIKELGLYGCLSDTKFIPEQYKLASPYDRLEMLRGLMDTDGWSEARGKSCRIKYCSVSETLADDVAFLVRSLGGNTTKRSFIPSYTYKGKKLKGKRAYELVLAMPDGVNPFHLSRKADKVVDRSLYPPSRIIASIEHIGREEAQCIKVAAEDGLYVTDDFIVTHNTVWLWDEMSKFGLGKDKDALNSTEPTSNCRIMVSTHKGTANEYYKIVRNPGRTPVVVMDWKNNPSRNRHIFRLVGGLPNGKPTLINESEADQKWFDFLDSWPEKAEELEKKAYEWTEDKLLSPWYIARCLRAGSTPQTMAQEYDRNPEGTEQQFFSEARLEKVRQKDVRRPKFRGYLKFDYDNPLGDVQFVQDPDGQVLVWCDILAGSPLLVGDTCVGCDISSGLGDSRTSNSVAIAFSRQTGEQIVEFATNRLLPDKFASYSLALAKWLHNSQLNWETNGPNGKAFTRTVKHHGYHNIYFREVADRISKKKTKQPGWGSSATGKQDILGNTESGGLRGAVYSGECKIRSQHLLEECRQFIYDETGKVVHSGSLNKTDKANQNEAHGDRVIAAAVAWLTVLDRPKKTLKQIEQSTDPARDTMAWRMLQHDRELEELAEEAAGSSW